VVPFRRPERRDDLLPGPLALAQARRGVPGRVRRRGPKQDAETLEKIGALLGTERGIFKAGHRELGNEPQWAQFGFQICLHFFQWFGRLGLCLGQLVVKYVDVRMLNNGRYARIISQK